MITTYHSCHADSRRHAVNEDLGQEAVVAGGDDGRGRPRNNAVVGGERRVKANAGLEEFSFGIVDCGPFAPGDDLDDLVDAETVDHGLAGHYPGLLGLVVMVHVAKSIESDRSRGKQAGEPLRSGVGVVDGALSVKMILHDVPVIGAQSGRRNHQDYALKCTIAVHVHGKGPNAGLVVKQIARDIAESGRIGRRSGRVGQR